MALYRMNREIDVRHVLPSIRVPTLVLHRIGDEGPLIDEGRVHRRPHPRRGVRRARRRDHGWWVANPTADRDEIQSFLLRTWERGEWEAVEPERVLATVLFTDIVDSTAKVAELGDRAWRELLERTTRWFAGSSSAIRGAKSTRPATASSRPSTARPGRSAARPRSSTSSAALGIEVRAGLHTGECEVVDGNVGGIAVHIGARVAARAGAGEVLVSRTVKDLVAGSGIQFADRGIAELKGVPGSWPLYAVESMNGSSR